MKNATAGASIAALLFIGFSAVESIYPWQTHERFTDIGPEYSPYIVASISLCLGLYAAWYAWTRAGVTGYAKLADNDSGHPSPSTPKPGSDETRPNPVNSIASVASYIVQLMTPNGKVVNFNRRSNDSSDSNEHLQDGSKERSSNGSSPDSLNSNNSINTIDGNIKQGAKKANNGVN